MRIPFSSNLGTKAMALVLGVLLWIFAFMENQETRYVPIQVRFETSSPELIVTPPFTEVSIEVKGPRRLMQSVRFDMIISKTISPENIEELTGKVTVPVTLTPEDFRVDDRIVFVDVPTVNVEVSRQMRKDLPVEVKWEGKPVPGFVRSEERTRVVPDKVSVIGPAALLENIDRIYTKPVNMNGSWGMLKLTLQIETRLNGQDVVCRPDRVEVQAEFVADVKQKTFENISVRPMAPSGYGYIVTVRPDTVSVTVEGTQQTIDDLKPEAVNAYVAISPSDGPRSTPYVGRPKVVAPPGLVVKSITPQDVEWTITQPQS